jgi:hypothetical protein
MGQIVYMRSDRGCGRTATRLTILVGCYTILAVVPAVSHYPILYSTKGLWPNPGYVVYILPYSYYNTSQVAVRTYSL